MCSHHWGYHLMLDCGKLAVEEEQLNDVGHLKRFVAEMLERVDMKAWGEPMVARLTDDDGDFPDSLSGYTVVQLLHTSNMTLHVCDKTRTLYFDLFSCKRFDQEDAIDVVRRYFAPGDVRVSFLTRHAE